MKDSGYAYGGNIKCLGGILVTSEDGSINLDYTFDSILEDVWTSSMKQISDILFERVNVMFGRSAKGGNYAYATTRVKARKAFLFPRDTYLKLLQMTVPEINRFIEESKYKQEIDELANRHSGIDLVEYALNLNLAREMNDILGFCQGELKMLMGSYLMRWDVWNIKSILRGKFSGTTDEAIRETLVPAGSLRLAQLQELIKKPGIPEVVDGLTGTIFYKPLQDAMDAYNKTHTLA